MLPEQGADPRLDEAAARGIRERRLDRSCRLLGISHWSYLTRPGQWIDTTEPSRTLAAAPRDVVAAAVRAVTDDWRPQIVLSVGSDGLTGHPDHIAMHDAVDTALRMPGWSPRHAWGAAVVDSDVHAANTSIELLSPRDGTSIGRERVEGVSTSRITHSIHSPGAVGSRRQAMDLYLDGLGSWSIDQLIKKYRLRGASPTLRAVFDMTGWETDHFSEIRPSEVRPRLSTWLAGCWKIAPIGALHALHARGLSVPDDVAVAGWDNLIISRQLWPPLTSVGPDKVSIVQTALQLLDDRINRYVGPGRHEIVPSQLVDSQLVDRESTRRGRLAAAREPGTKLG